MSTYSKGGEELFTGPPEKGSAAKDALSFAREFDEDFQIEPDANIEAAPAFFRGFITELGYEQERVAWVLGPEENKIGSATRVFPDNSILETHILYVPKREIQRAVRAAEITLTLRANTGSTIQRELMYELRVDAVGRTRVIRENVDQNDHDPLGNFTPQFAHPEVPEEAQEIVTATMREAEMLAIGEDPTLDVELQDLRGRNDYFRVASDERRMIYANQAFERSMGFADERPIGLRELTQLRAIILADI